jgi:carboxypeptidase T
MRLYSQAPLVLFWLVVALLAAGIGPAPLAASPAVPDAIGRYSAAGVTTREQRSAIAATGAAIETVGPNYVEISATPDEVQQLQALGFVLRPAAHLLDFPPADEAFHNYAELVAEIQLVAAAHPAIVELFSIGQSYEGRELWAAKISDNVAADEEEPEALFVGQYHAREHLTPEMTLSILHLLVDSYGEPGSESVTALVDSREVYVVFSLNPDGSEYDIASGSYQWWRKNRQPNTDSTHGTDLNRNHSYRWGCCNGSSGITTSETYRGTAPGSAPEVAAMEAFVNSRVISDEQQIKVAISFHTYGEQVMWPYGYTYDDLPDDMRPDDLAAFAAMGQTMAATNGFTPQQSSDLYIIDGDFGDWAYGTHRIFAFLFELSPKTTFYPPGSQIAAMTQRNHAAVLYLLTNAACPYAVIGKAGLCELTRHQSLPFVISGTG